MAIEKQPTCQLNRIDFLITNLCNLRCRMCNYRVNNFFTKMIPLNKIKSIIEEASDLGTEILGLSGGEPMIRKDIYEIIHFASSRGLKVRLMTNGVLVGEKEARQLIDSGLNAVSVSLEGPEEINDWIRGEGNYQKALNAIRYFEKYRGQNHDFTAVGITLSQCNYRYLLSFCKFLLEEIGIGAVTINPFEKMMLMAKGREIRQKEFLLDMEQMDDFRTELEKVSEYAIKMGSRMPAPQFLKKIPDYFLGKAIVPEKGCFIPRTTWGIQTDGRVFPCWKTSSVGDLNQMSLKDILGLPSYQEFVQAASTGKCGGCLTSCYEELYF